MEDLFDTLPVPYRMERLGRMRELIMQIEADCKRYKDLKQKVKAGVGDDSDREELQRRETWMKRNVTAYMHLNSMSIEGVTCAGIGGFSTSSYQRM